MRAEWEEIDPSVAGRPARRYHRLTPEGALAARAELAALYARLRPRLAGGPKLAGGAAFVPAPGW